ncbi:hypothetical protein RFI_13235 [Reticulomyxa filosa]|uniref:Mon2/Sec7/BIG1-like HDS domain-containing protein n=1 Tax=Reticulomyxa filosa TaxID=46433 RepID=X6NCA3_RETFI|nr:hypothetical protein RFI_13235 [Reticulomyxa filosa]|eukprot:ETO23925.1 hypothetical protein RFI_13235 [Reticulomyxa filosa]
MDRIRFVWLRIWKILADHFCFAGTHPNLRISLSAIDSLRQLADKFLEKDELSNFNFQKDFLKPFQLIILETTSGDVRELLVQCMARLIKSRHRNIKSGWKCVFAVLGAAARDNNEQLVTSCFDTLMTAIDLYFPLIEQVSARPLSKMSEDELLLSLPLLNANANKTTEMKISSSNNNESKLPEANESSREMENNRDDTSRLGMEESIRRLKLLRTDALADCIDTLIAFVANRFTKLSSFAIDCLSKTGQFLFACDRFLPSNAATSSVLQESEMQWTSLAASGGLSMVYLSNSLTGGCPDMGRPLIKAWFLCLLGLSRTVSDYRLEVRGYALSVLFRLLRTHGVIFDQLMWTRAFQRLVFPIFAELRQSMGPTLLPSGELLFKETKLLSKPIHEDEKYHADESNDWKDIKPTRLSVGLSEDSVLNNNSKNKAKNKNKNKIKVKVKIKVKDQDKHENRNDGNANTDTNVNDNNNDEFKTTEKKQIQGSDNNEPNPRPRSRSISDDAEAALTSKISIQTIVREECAWLETTCHPALSAMVELFNQFFVVDQTLLHDVVCLLTSFISMVCIPRFFFFLYMYFNLCIELKCNCIMRVHHFKTSFFFYVYQKQSSEASRIGLQCLSRLVDVNATRFTTNHWSIVIGDIIQALNQTLPHRLRSKTLKKFVQSQTKTESAGDTNNTEVNKTEMPTFANNLSNSKGLVIQAEAVLNLLQLLRQVWKKIIFSFYPNKITLNIYFCVFSFPFKIDITKFFPFSNKASMC